MNKRNFFFLLALCFVSSTSAQISFVIKELYVCQYNVKINKKKFVEGIDDGPKISVKCVFRNLGKDSIVLYPTKSQVNIEYNYRGHKYTRELFLSNIKENKVLTLFSGDSVLWGGGTYLLNRTLHAYEKLNYTKEVIEILPTIRVRYKDAKYAILSSEIESVVATDGR